jgi:hypothetical protein
LSQCKELLEHLEQKLLPESPQPFPIPDQSVALNALVAWILWTAGTCFLSYIEYKHPSVWTLIAKHYKSHKYGQHLQSDQEPQNERNMLLFHIVSSGLLFGAPRSHLERIRMALRTVKLQDRTDAWVNLMTAMERELTVSNLGVRYSSRSKDKITLRHLWPVYRPSFVGNFLIFASLLLISVYRSSSAFLAVPGLDRFTRIVTLISVVLTLGSVMSGLYLQWQTGKIRFKGVVSAFPLTCIIHKSPCF